MAYWNCKVKGEFDKSYGYELPLYRKQTGMVKYIQGFNTKFVKWIGATVKDIKMEGDLAEVYMDLRTRMMIPRIKPFVSNSTIKERWAKVEGVWYHVPARFADNR